LFFFLYFEFFMDILVVVPAYNEEKTISRVVTGLRKHNYDVLVIDDGSEDKTAQLAKEAGARVLRHFFNLGQGAAIRTGFDFILNSGLNPDVVVTFDADGQHLPEDILVLVRPILEGEAEVVNGSRFKKNQIIPLARFLMNQVANLATFILFGLWVSDSQSGMRAFKKDVLKKIEIRAAGFDWASELIAEIKKKKSKFKEVPIRVKYSQYSLSKGQNFFVGLKTFFRLLFKRLNNS
jgi:glycosyltransferase involved in cell wall biosynthesis